VTQELETAPDRTVEAAGREKDAARGTYRRTALAIAEGKKLNAKEVAEMTNAMNVLGYSWDDLEQDVSALGKVAGLRGTWSEKKADDLQRVREKAVKVRDALHEKLILAEREIQLANYRLRKLSELGNSIEGIQRQHPRVFPAV
jgi:hypothetical protein